MKFTAQQIADFLGGIVDGNPNEEVWDISGIENGKKGSLCFLANPLYEKYLYSTEASVVLVSNDFNSSASVKPTLVRVVDPYASFARILAMVGEAVSTKRNGIDPTAIVHETVQFDDRQDVWIGPYVVIEANVQIGKGVYIYPHTYIGYNSKIGNDTVLYSGVKVYHGTQIGSRCIIHSGVVLGSDGFGFAPQSDGSYLKIPQLGNVIIEDDVEIGANTTVDRATMSSTKIERGAKIDNLVQLAHNSRVGKHTVIASQAGISGSTSVGDYCMIGGQVGLSGHISIGNHVKIAAQSGIAGNVPDGSELMGSPAFDARKYKRAFILFKNIESMEQRLRNLEKRRDK